MAASSEDTPTFGPRTVHLCIDMQRIFAEDSPWHTPWMARVTPTVETLVAAHPERTIFTRFIPPYTPDEAVGMWQPYFERWRALTRAAIDPKLLDIIPELARYAAPGRTVDKPAYSPFHNTRLLDLLRTLAADTLVMSGTETDVCVLAAVFAAMDHGFRVILARDALCSSADETHDALMKVYHDRFSQQVCLMETRHIIERWR